MQGVGCGQAGTRILFNSSRCLFLLSFPLLSFLSPVKRFSVATMFKRYAKDLPEEVLNWRLGYAVLGMLGPA